MNSIRTQETEKPQGNLFLADDVERMINTACEDFSISRKTLFTSKDRSIGILRQMIWYVSSRHFRIKQMYVAEIFKRDRSTVSTGARNVEFKLRKYGSKWSGFKFCQKLMGERSEDLEQTGRHRIVKWMLQNCSEYIEHRHHTNSLREIELELEKYGFKLAVMRMKKDGNSANS